MPRRRRDTRPREITTRYDTTCSETGRTIERGERCLYYPSTKDVYALDSLAAYQWRMAEADRQMGFDY